jgi:hypothetical protein
MFPEKSMRGSPCGRASISTSDSRHHQAHFFALTSARTHRGTESDNKRIFTTP